MLGLSVEHILIILFALAVFGKPALVLITKAFPVLLPFVPLLEKLTLGGSTKKDGYDENLFNAVMFKLETNHFEHIPSKDDFNNLSKTLGEIRDGVRDMNLKIDKIEPCQK